MNLICWLVDHNWRTHRDGVIQCCRCLARPYDDLTLPEWWLNFVRFGGGRTLREFPKRLAKRVPIWWRSRPCWFKDHEWSPISQHCFRCGQTGIQIAEYGEWTWPVWKKLWRGWLQDRLRMLKGEKPK